MSEPDDSPPRRITGRGSPEPEPDRATRILKCLVMVALGVMFVVLAWQRLRWIG